jgi:hypothetical protein
MRISLGRERDRHGRVCYVRKTVQLKPATSIPEPSGFVDEPFQLVYEAGISLGIVFDRDNH